MFKSPLKCVASLLFSTLLCLPLAAQADSTDMPDSTNMTPTKAEPVLPHVVFTSDCRDAPNIQAVIIASSGGVGYKNSPARGACPRGYFPKAFKSYVGQGLGYGEWNWRLQCCRTKVDYK
jgi:hypothetical protein